MTESEEYQAKPSVWPPAYFGSPFWVASPWNSPLSLQHCHLEVPRSSCL